MPEIWLDYGTSEVILDIRYENILNHIKPDFNYMQEKLLGDYINEKVSFKDSNLVLILNPFKQMAPILKQLIYKSDLLNKNLEIATLKNIPLNFKKDLVNQEIHLSGIGHGEILSTISKFKKVIVLEKILYDPMFGFSCSPTEITRLLYAKAMDQVYSHIKNKMPTPGILGDPLKIALETVKEINLEFLHVISNNEGINRISYEGDVDESLANLLEIFKGLTKKQIEISKSVILSGNTNLDAQKTLSNSFNVLWNNYKAVKENGIIVFLSENTGGIGNGALQEFIDNKLPSTRIDGHNYLKDLEHLNYLNLLRDKYEIYIISTLPKLYIQKIGLRDIPKIKDGLEIILSKYGKNSKTLIITNSELNIIN
ncbi:MAG: hypothetical protein M3162_00995 [Thermoproteota archaeon]|nr:hypothetical protein [Thermoproteota archaeon]